jgi:lipid-binding SYLF domain-containing protein
MRRTRNYIFIKVLRVAGWLLVVLVIAYLVTGFAMSGEYGFGRLMHADTAKWWHRILHTPLLVVVVAHAATASYFAWLRWFKKHKRR